MGGGLSETEQEDNSRKKKRRVIILILLLLLLLSIGSCAMWQFSQPKADPGATVQAHEGKSDEEVIAGGRAVQLRAYCPRRGRGLVRWAGCP